MSTVMNYGVYMRCKSVTAQHFTIVGSFVEPSITALANPKGSLE